VRIIESVSSVVYPGIVHCTCYLFCLDLSDSPTSRAVLWGTIGSKMDEGLKVQQLLTISTGFVCM